MISQYSKENTHGAASFLIKLKNNNLITTLLNLKMSASIDNYCSKHFRIFQIYQNKHL